MTKLSVFADTSHNRSRAYQPAIVLGCVRCGVCPLTDDVALSWSAHTTEQRSTFCHQALNGTFFLLSFTISCYHLQFHVIIHNFMLSFTISCYHLLFHVIIHYFMLSFTISCYHLLFHVIIHNFMLLFTISCYHSPFHVIIHNFML